MGEQHPFSAARQMVLLSSEMGVLPVEPSKVRKRWRLQPGKIFLIDLIEKKIVDNEEIKSKYAKF